jgi:hypothetical protein
MFAYQTFSQGIQQSNFLNPVEEEVYHPQAPQMVSHFMNQ